MRAVMVLCVAFVLVACGNQSTSGVSPDVMTQGAMYLNATLARNELNARYTEPVRIANATATAVALTQVARLAITESAMHAQATEDARQAQLNSEATWVAVIATAIQAAANAEATQAAQQANAQSTAAAQEAARQQELANMQATQSALENEMTAAAQTAEAEAATAQAQIFAAQTEQANVANAQSTAEAAALETQNAPDAAATTIFQDLTLNDAQAAYARAQERLKQDEMFWQAVKYAGVALLVLILLTAIYLWARAVEYTIQSKGAVANANATDILNEAKANAEGILLEAQARAKEIESKAFRNLTIVSETTRSVIRMGQGGGLVIQPIQVAQLEAVAEQFQSALPPAEVPGVPKPKFSPATVKLISFLERCQIKNLRNRQMPVENKQRQITPAGDFKNSNWRNWAIRHLESEGAVYSLDGVGVFVAGQYGTLDNLIRAVRTGQIAEPPTFEEEGSQLFEHNPSLQEG